MAAAEQGAEEYVKMVERIKGLSAVVDLFVIAEDGYVGVEALLPLVQVCIARAHPHPCITPTHYHSHRPRTHNHRRLGGEYQPHTYFKAGAMSTSVWKEVLGDRTGVRGVRTRVGTLARCGSRLPDLYAHARTRAHTHTYPLPFHAPDAHSSTPPVCRRDACLLRRLRHLCAPSRSLQSENPILLLIIACSPFSHPYAPYMGHVSSSLSLSIPNHRL